MHGSEASDGLLVSVDAVTAAKAGAPGTTAGVAGLAHEGHGGVAAGPAGAVSEERRECRRPVIVLRSEETRGTVALPEAERRTMTDVDMLGRS
jgi:hypothetical protein